MLSVIYHQLFLMYLLSRVLLEWEEGEGKWVLFQFFRKFRYPLHFIMTTHHPY